MADSKLEELNKIKEDLFSLYPFATRITVSFEGDKIFVKPEEKYVVIPDLDSKE